MERLTMEDVEIDNRDSATTWLWLPNVVGYLEVTKTDLEELLQNMIDNNDGVS